MKMAVVMMVLFGIIIGVATFIENDYGTQTARALVYKAKWFEIFLLYFIALVLFNIIRFKTYKRNFPAFLFHASFVLIAVGALVTRYFGYEGIMSIREGAQTDLMRSDVKKLLVSAKDKEKIASIEEDLYLSSMTPNRIVKEIDLGGKQVKVELLEYLPTMKEVVVEDANGTKVLELKVSTGSRGDLYYLAKGKSIDLGSFKIGFDVEPGTDKPTFLIKQSGDGLVVSFPFILETLSMDDQSMGELKGGEHPFQKRMLYRFGQNAVVLKDIYDKATIKVVADGLKAKQGKKEYMKWRVSVGEKSKEVVTTPYYGGMGRPHTFVLDDVEVTLQVGTKPIQLPFALKLDDFVLERYPGSNTPSSYSSHVTVIDKEHNKTFPYHIYMNHVLDYRGYRFFQSSYDADEKGTILSVNKDPGTIVTYIAYALMTIGMMLSLFWPTGRFRKLFAQAKQMSTLAPTVLFALTMLFAQPLDASTVPTQEEVIEHLQKYNPEHLEKLSKLAVQDHRGRMKPIDTLASEVVRKITGKSSFYGLDAMQLFLAMIVEPEMMQQVKMIKIDHPKIAKKIGLDPSAKYASFKDFFTPQGYKLYDDVSVAARKKPLDQSAYDKELLKVDERVNVAFLTYQGKLLRIYPKPNDLNNAWYSPIDAITQFSSPHASEVKISISAYFMMIGEALKSGDWSKADIALRGIEKIQAKYGAAVKPSKEQIELEVLYNKLSIFSKLVPIYLLLGLLLFILAIWHVVRSSKRVIYLFRALKLFVVIAFLMHLLGMGLRWYISGYAPWSNAYESLVFIAAATLLAGLLIARDHPFGLAGATLLSGFTMLVAHLSFINPEITTLVPVLKSYWLLIHVATIISGDGFLGLGSMLAFMMLILYALPYRKNEERFVATIKQLAVLSEISLIIGLHIFTIGNFLGGVWANESWGRYWGWDAKETWAAVTILVYAAVLHLRFVPSLRSKFVYAVASTWAYFSVLMTYFGVNYYLSGLHSYAAGDPLPIPTWVYVAVATLAVLTLLASRNRKLA